MNMPQHSPHSSPRGSVSGPSSSSIGVMDPTAVAVAKIAQLEAQVAQLIQHAHQQHQQQHPVAASPRIEASGIKPPPMWKFTGKVGVEVDRFLRDMRTQFTLSPSKVPTDQAKITWAVAFFGDTAADWWEKDSVVNPVATWDEFVTRLHRRFRPIEAVVAARTQLRNLRQKGGVSGYSSLFMNILSHISDMSEADQIFSFVEGLADREVIFRVKQQRLKSLSETIIAAVQAESDLGARGGHQSRHSYSSSASHGHSSSASSSTHVPMDVNAVYGDSESYGHDDSDSHDRPASQQSSSSDSMETMIQKAVEARLAALQLPKSSSQSQSQSSGSSRSSQDTRRNGNRFSAEKERLYNEGRCFKCKKTGHQSRECKADF